MDAAYTGKQIAQRRKTLGMTQKNLADRLNITDKAVSKWERGLNFPDLGLMEELAKALETTPAQLLGLEMQTRDEIVSSMAELSEAQIAQTRQHIRWMAWGCILGAALLMIVYSFFGNDWEKNQYAYQILGCIIFAAAAAGVWLLFRYEEIRRWEIADWLIFYGALLPLVFWCGIAFLTGYGPHRAVSVVTAVLTAALTQLLFCRTMAAEVGKALPLIVTSCYALWRIPREYPIDADVMLFAIPAASCLLVWGICIAIRTAKGKAGRLSRKSMLLIMVVAVILCATFFRTPLVRIYIHLYHEKLEGYAQALLDDNTEIAHDQYGFWDVTAYPAAGMVQFYTGGSGLVPNASYEGFYYSEDGAHIPFQNVDVPINENGDHAYWSDGTDNWGESDRIREKWFWFEAHF